MARTAAQMDKANRAICYALRNPPAGTKRSSLKAIAGMVVKTDGTHPSFQAVSEAAKQFKLEKEQRGRRKGDKKTLDEPGSCSPSLNGRSPTMKDNPAYPNLSF